MKKTVFLFSILLLSACGWKIYPDKNQIAADFAAAYPADCQLVSQEFPQEIDSNTLKVPVRFTCEHRQIDPELTYALVYVYNTEGDGKRWQFQKEVRSLKSHDTLPRALTAVEEYRRDMKRHQADIEAGTVSGGKDANTQTPENSAYVTPVTISDKVIEVKTLKPGEPIPPEK